MSNMLPSHTSLMWREMYGTMGAYKDEVKDLLRSTKKTRTKKSKSYTEMYYMYTNLLTKYGVLNFKTDKLS